MEFVIQIKDGMPFEHPIAVDNFLEAFPNKTLESLSPDFAEFQRIPCPSLVYATLNSPYPSYEWENGIVKDVWDITEMSAEEKAAKIADAKAQPHPEGWTFNEDLCLWEINLNAPGSSPNVIG